MLLNSDVYYYLFFLTLFRIILFILIIMCMSTLSFKHVDPGTHIVVDISA